MELTPPVIEALTRFFTVLAAVVAACGAGWKFFAWWLDRRDQARIDSAAFFAKDDAPVWSKAFGEEQLMRMHFKRLTGVDRRSGHRALYRLHERLGKTDDDWISLRRAGGFVRTRGEAAYVRKLRRFDHLKTAGSILWGLALSALGLFLVAVMVAWVEKSIGHTWRALDLFVLLLGIAYAAMFFLWAFAMYISVRRTVTVVHLRNRLTALRREKRAKQPKIATLP